MVLGERCVVKEAYFQKMFWCLSYLHNIVPKILSLYINKFVNITDKSTYIWDRSIISSIKPKFDDTFLGVLYKLWIWNWSASSANQNKNNFTFATCTKHVYQQKNPSSHFGLLTKETIDLSRILHSSKFEFSKRSTKFNATSLLI